MCEARIRFFKTLWVYEVKEGLAHKGKWDLCNSILIFQRQSLESSKKDIEDEDADCRSSLEFTYGS